MSKDGLQYRKDVSFKIAKNSRVGNNTATINGRQNQGRNNEELELKKAIMLSSEMKEFIKIQYTTNIKLLMAGIPVLFIGMLFPPVLLIALGLIVGSLICMATNWNRINQEHKTRKQIQTDIRKRLTEPVKSVIDEDYEFWRLQDKRLDYNKLIPID